MQAQMALQARCAQCYRPLCAPSASAPRAVGWAPAPGRQAVQPQRSRLIMHSAASLDPASSSGSGTAAGLEPRLKARSEGRATYKPSSFKELVEDATDSVAAVRARERPHCQLGPLGVGALTVCAWCCRPSTTA